MKSRALIVAVVCVAAIVGSHQLRGTQTVTLVQTAPPQARVVKALGRSHLSLVADLFWIRSIAVSINLREPAAGKALIGWCRFVSELDPRFVYPYMLGGLLGPMTIDETNYNVEEANELLRAGMTNVPNDFRLGIYLSFNQLELQHDVASAAQTLAQTAKAPNVPPYIGLLATRLLAQSNAFDAASKLVAELENSDDPELRGFFERRKLEVERDRILVDLQAAVTEYARRFGSPPQTLEQLVEKNLVVAIPEDPAGGVFFIQRDGAVLSTSGGRLAAFKQKRDLP